MVCECNICLRREILTKLRLRPETCKTSLSVRNRKGTCILYTAVVKERKDVSKSCIFFWIGGGFAIEAAQKAPPCRVVDGRYEITPLEGRHGAVCKHVG